MIQSLSDEWIRLKRIENNANNCGENKKKEEYNKNGKYVNNCICHQNINDTHTYIHLCEYDNQIQSISIQSCLQLLLVELEIYAAKLYNAVTNFFFPPLLIPMN